MWEWIISFKNWVNCLPKIVIFYKLYFIQIDMSYKAIFELFLQIHTFTNVDLPCQGIYRLRACIYCLEGSQKVHALPFDFMQASKKPPPNKKKILYSPQLDPLYFYSKAGIIKYSDDKVSLQDQVRFKLEVQSFPRLHSDNVYIEFDLLFAEFNTTMNLSTNKFDGTVVASKKFKLENLQHGLLNYCQGQFIGQYTSKFCFTIFACLSNFKFGKYKLPHQNEEIDHQDSEGNITKNKIKKQSEGFKIKQKQRSEVKTFEQFLKWVQKYYKQKVPNVLSYFYNTYVKNLRYFYYLAQQKLHQKSIVSRKRILKVPKQFLQLPNSKQKNDTQETQVSQKEFRKYMTDFQPQKMTLNTILQQINIIHTDIYMFLIEVEKEFQFDQLMLNKMKRQFDTYIKDRYGQRVFRSVVTSSDASVSNRQNKDVAKKMRQKQKTMQTVSYPIEDLSFVQAKDMLQFLFYQVTIPKKSQNQIQSQKQEHNQQKLKKKSSKQATAQCKKQQKTDSMSQLVSQLNKNSPKKGQNLKKLPSKQKISQQDVVKQALQENQLIKTQQQQQMKQEKQLVSQLNISMQCINSKIGSQLIDQNQDDNSEDVYKNVSHQKAEVDSQMTEKSLQNDDFYQNNLKENIFQGISQISFKNPTIKRNKSIEQQLPPLEYHQKKMLIVMCHGFQGSYYDMTMLLRGLKQVLPQASYLIARSNEGLTEGDIQQMGERLAKQVQSYVKNYMEKQTVIINFIGHSMGGIIARTGIKYLMKNYSNQFGFFCSLSSPHLGYLNGVDGMIKAGLWAILKFKPIRSLQQLKMDDSKDLRKTFLYQLSENGSLKRFRKIILFSSFQDSYVSWHSARISAHNEKKTQMTKVQQQMVQNILGNQPIHRIDVNFNVKTKNLDSFIGRTAHINLIIQESLFKIINSTIPQLFDIRVVQSNK